MVTTSLMTAQEFAQLPDDGYRYELIRGELIRMAPPDPLHGKRQGRVVFHFVAYADRFGGLATGEAAYHLEVDPDTVLALDATYTRPERAPEAERHGFGEDAPDVAVEIDSPSNRPGERRRKVRAYHQAGARIVLFVNGDRRTVTVEHADGRSEILHEGDVLDGSDVMPGFRLPVAEFFR
jgi:Uma2 family endonuclease